MREIEVKARVNNIKRLLNNASKQGITFGEPIFQNDTTYETRLSKNDPKWNIFRIREQDNKTILTMKYKASSRSRDNHERETIVENAKEVTDMLERVGYSFGVNIRKKRRTAKYNDIEICLDVVEDLGSFIEVEKLADDEADVDVIQSELWNILLKLGIEQKERVHEGYDTLMHKFLKTVK